MNALAMHESLGAILLGLIEGITEFIPVSSTGHLLLAEEWLPRQSDTFNVVIQSGAVLAVLLAFSGRIREMAANWRHPATREYLSRLALAFLVTVVGGLVLHVVHFELPATALPVALATLIGGILILCIEHTHGKRSGGKAISRNTAVLLGLLQIAAAVFPGLSRSGATILGAIALGVARPAAVEFSFLLGVPTLLAAGGFKILTTVASGEFHGENVFPLLLGFFAAAVSAFAVVRWLLSFVQTHRFTGFGWYRIALGSAILLFF